MAEDPVLLEMTALCHEGLGQLEQAAAIWQPLFDKDQHSAHAVRLAGIQFELNQLDAADKTIIAGLTAADVNTSTIALPKTNTTLQRVPAAAALLNLKAQTTLMRDPSAHAKSQQYLTSALKICPDYELARRNLANLTTPAGEQ